MTMSGCRIGRVKFHRGGEIVPLNTTKYEGVQADLLSISRQIADMMPDMAGCFVVGWNKEGHYSVGWRSGESSIPPRMMPSWLAEIARDEMIVQDTACDVFNRAFQGEED